MTQNKNQGTRFETKLIQTLKPHALWIHRLAEQGIDDQGDIRFVPRGADADAFYVEARHRQNLSIHTALANHAAKIERNVEDEIGIPILIWKRTTRKPGNKIRTSDGIVVVQTLPDWIASL